MLQFRMLALLQLEILLAKILQNIRYIMHKYIFLHIASEDQTRQMIKYK